MRLHVHHVLLSLEPGGLENGVVNVVNGLDPARFRSSVCCLQRSGPFAERIHGDGVAVQSMGLGRGNDWRLPLRLASLFRASRPDIVHTRNAEAFFYAGVAARLAAVPILIHSEHGRTFNDRPLRFRAQRLLSRWTDGIFAVSEQLRQDLIRHVGLPSARVDVLHNGVDLKRFETFEGAPARAALALPEQAFVVGSVGRLVAVKNYSMLIRAFAMLQRADARLVLAGEGPERGALEQLAAELGVAPRVHFLGHRDDVALVLAALDLFALPSRSEGMSNTLLEAMAAGRPVVATRIGGNPEIVRDGLDGELLPSDDAPAFADALGRFALQPARCVEMGANARERVRSRFSIEAMVDRYECYYQTHFARVKSAKPSDGSGVMP